jgi:hypothetical protein
MQYTLRDVPALVDAELRRRSAVEGKSLNAVAIDALIRGTGLGETPVRHRDLGDVAGTWKRDARFDRALQEQDRVDDSLWAETGSAG